VGGRLLVVAGLTAAACVAAGGAIAAQGDPQTKLVAADQAKARSVVLKLADLAPAPWKAERSSGDSGRPRCRNYHPDFSDIVRTGRVSGTEFTAGTIFVSSDVSVYAGRGAQAAWARVVTPQLQSCIGEVTTKAFGKPPAAQLLASVRRAFPQATERSAAYRVTVSVLSQGKTTHAYVDLVLLKQGRIAADLTIVTVGRPFPDGELRRLAALMARRMH
jgi:hypothetical protein